MKKNNFFSKHFAKLVSVVRFDDHGGEAPGLAEPESSPPDHGHPQPSGRLDGLRDDPQHQEKHSHHLRTPHSSIFSYYFIYHDNVIRIIKLFNSLL